MDESDNGFDGGNGAEAKNGGAGHDAPAGTTRREFLTLALVTGSGVALVGVPRPLFAGGGDVPSCATETLQKIGGLYPACPRPSLISTRKVRIPIRKRDTAPRRRSTYPRLAGPSVATTSRVTSAWVPVG